MMDIHSHKWITSILEHCGGNDLKDKLGPEPVEGGTALGNISSYFVTRYGFSPGMVVFDFFMFGRYLLTEGCRVCYRTVHWRQLSDPGFNELGTRRLCGIFRYF